LHNIDFSHKLYTMDIKTIVEKSGVSLSTVYRVLQGNQVISPETTERVNKAIKELGLEPELMAKRRQGLGKGIKHKQITFVLLGSDPLEANMEMVCCLENELKKLNLNLIFTQTNSVKELNNIINKQQTDGLILHGWQIKPETIETINNLNKIPCVWLLTHIENWGNQVQPDNAAIGRCAAKHAIDNNLQKSVYFIPDSVCPAFKRRGKVFEETLAQAGFKAEAFRSDEKLDKTKTSQTNTIVLPQLLNRNIEAIKRANAIFVLDESHLGAIYSIMAAHNIMPGKNIKVISCISSENSAKTFATSQLSLMIDINMKQIGIQAAKLLIQKIKDPQSVIRTTVYVKPKIIEPTQ
jgi:LacI family transcriptional regulator